MTGVQTCALPISQSRYYAYNQGMAELEAEQEAMAAEAEAEEENKDLEIIKSRVHSFATCDIEYADGLEMEKEIIAAAQRMAEEIERLKEEEQYEFVRANHAEEMLAAKDKELAALRKMSPVRCEECKHSEICNRYVRMPKLRVANKKALLDYCSCGVRKEAPDGK